VNGFSAYARRQEAQWRQWIEEGRRLASQREDLIAQGVNPAPSRAATPGRRAMTITVTYSPTTGLTVTPAQQTASNWRAW
jgi:hypothetical protein